MEKKFTVFIDQRNRTNYQVLAKDEDEAIQKAKKLYRKNFEIPTMSIEDRWLVESDGEDK